MILLPADSVKEKQTKIISNSWLDASNTGTRRTLKTWFHTVWASLGSPKQLIHATDPNAPILSTIFFFIFSVLMYALPTLLLIALITVVAVVLSGGRAAVGFLLSFGFSSVFIVLFLVPVALCPIWAIMTHLILKLISKHEFPFGRTVQVFCFASAPLLFLTIPLVNYFFYPVALIWWAVTIAFMLCVAQKISGIKSVIATFTPVVLAISLLFILFLGLQIFNMVTFSKMMTTRQTTSSQVITPTQTPTPISLED